MKQVGNVWLIILVIITIIAAAGGAYFYGQNQGLKKLTASPSGVAVSQAPVYGNQSYVPEPTATPVANKATVVYEAEGSFSIPEKAELQKKVIDPFVDYYAMENTGQTLLTLTISKNLQASRDTYPYQAQAIFQGGGNMGFLIMKVGAGVDWWFPECMMGCNLSAAYKAKYPEIAVKVQ